MGLWLALALLRRGLHPPRPELPIQSRLVGVYFPAGGIHDMHDAAWAGFAVEVFCCFGDGMALCTPLSDLFC